MEFRYLPQVEKQPEESAFPPKPMPQGTNQLLPLPMGRTEVAPFSGMGRKSASVRESSAINQRGQLSLHFYLKTKLCPKCLRTLENTKSGR